MKLLIGFFDAGLPFSGDLDISKSSLGGSETAAYYMARHLAARGHEVKFINHCSKSGQYHNVSWFTQSMFPQVAAAADFDVFICSRFIDQLCANFRSRWNVVWAHDMPPEDKNAYTSRLWAIDQMFVMSEFQANAYRDMQPMFPRDAWDRIITVTRNGIDLKLIQKSIKNVKRHPKRLFYMSRPERGLGTLLNKFFPLLKNKDPDLELYFCSYDLGQLSQVLPQHLKDFYEYIYRLASQIPGVVNLGTLGKSDLYQALASSQILLYPTDFPEISCISAMEAMACGTPVVSTADFALPETVGDAGILIPGKISDVDYLHRLMDAVSDLTENGGLHKELQRRGLERAQALDWALVAEQWESLFIEQFERRSARNRAGVCRRFIFMSDLVVANKFAQEYPEECKEELELTSKLLEATEGEPERYSLEHDLQAALDTWESNTRFQWIADRVPEGAETLLDVGCNVGMLFAHLSKRFPKLRMTGVDSSESLISKAHEFVAKCVEHPGNVNLICKRVQDFEGQFDVVVCAETLEHVKDTQEFISYLERLCKPGGTLIFTVPSGPWEAESFHEPRKAWIREHVHHFDFDDLRAIFGQKKKYNIDMTYTGVGSRGDLLGNWVLFYVNDPKRETGKIDYKRKITTTRPYQKISTCMIVKNEEDNVLRCLKSLLDVMDEIIVYDTGSSDHTEEIVSWVSDRYKPVIRYIKGYWDQDEGFEGARNRSMETATGDWIFWIDADEVLFGDRQMYKFINRGNVFPGFIVRQNHLVLDLATEPDNPVRLFRRDTGVKFFGLIHEHPEFVLNKPLSPVLCLPDVQIAHYGYLTESIRREKCAKRNMPLLLKDREKYPDRKLGLLFLQRDYIHIAEWNIQKENGTITEEATKYLREVVRIYNFMFKDFEGHPQENSFWLYSLGFYQQALRILGEMGISPIGDEGDPPFEAALGLAGAFCGISAENSKIPVSRRWFADKAELIQWLAREGRKLDEVLIPQRLF